MVGALEKEYWNQARETLTATWRTKKKIKLLTVFYSKIRNEDLKMIEHDGPFLKLAMGLLLVMMVLYGVTVLIVAHQRKEWEKERTHESEALLKTY